MVPVEHRCDAIEAEAVQVVFFHPVFAVGKEEILYRILAIVEAPRAPGGMMPGFPGIEVKVFPISLLTQYLFLRFARFFIHFLVFCDKDTTF